MRSFFKAFLIAVPKDTMHPRISLSAYGMTLKQIGMQFAQYEGLSTKRYCGYRLCYPVQLAFAEQTVSNSGWVLRNLSRYKIVEAFAQLDVNQDRLSATRLR